MTKNKKHKYTGLPMSFIEPLVKVMRCVDMQLQTHIHELRGRRLRQDMQLKQTEG